MTPVQRKPYQLVVWGDGKFPSDEPAVRLHFDTLQDALTALDTQQNSGCYRSHADGVYKHSGNWKLVAQFS